MLGILKWFFFIFSSFLSSSSAPSSSSFSFFLSTPSWELSQFSCVRLCVTPWTVARQAPLSMGLSRREYWSELLSSRGVFLSQGSNTSLLCLLHWQAGSLPLATLGKPQIICIPILKSKSLAGYLKNEPAFNQTSLVFILKPPWSSSWNIEKPNLQEELEQRQ